MDSGLEFTFDTRDNMSLRATLRDREDRSTFPNCSPLIDNQIIQSP